MPTPKPRAEPRLGREKIVPRSRLRALGASLRRRGLRIVFTNGCFDLIHPGHIALFEAARRLGDLLVVGVNSDDSVRALGKGAGRPIVGERDRARVVASLECVDLVTIFGEPTPLRTIESLRPHVLVKGADWGARAIVGADFVRAHGGKVVRIRLTSGYSTTCLIDRIRRGA